MRKEVTQLCCLYETCASHNLGKSVNPYMMSIPVAGPFNQVGVDAIKFPCSSREKGYTVAFIDYLMKWSEVFATANQTLRVLVKHISRHGVPQNYCLTGVQPFSLNLCWMFTK